MKNRIQLFAFLFLFQWSLFSQTKISGIVKDSKTKEPLPGASIFAPQTTNGGATDENGYFSFSLNEGQNEILISFIGYESVIVPANSFLDKGKQNVVYLNMITNTLNEVIIKKISAEQRAKYLEVFNNEFIGLGKIAKKTKILNPEVLQFDMNPDKTILTVTADSPIRMINEKTGYQISYELVLFESRMVQERNQKLTTYFGYPFFKDIVDEKKLDRKKVAKVRLECYKGSTMHFIRSLHNGNIEEEGFLVKKFKKDLNPKYPGDDAVKKARENYENNEAFFAHLPPKYLYTYDEAFDKVHQLVFERDNGKYFYFPNLLSVTYTKEGEESKYSEYTHTHHSKSQLSHFQLLEDKPIEIYADGNYANPELLGNFGYMGWKKMGEMLPFDYQSEENITD
jgi:carboxypeptidase-like protein